VSIARAIVHRPRAVLLDEPFTGLDAAGAAALSGALEGLASRGAALVLVTHNLGEGLALATQAAVMLGGRFARHEPAAGLDPMRFADEYRTMLSIEY
jgi:ABC-type multidrug transport system ATPase subunit